ncbi:Crp/Fnr family transcriptional regulator [Limosilactobacillus gastricus]|uniref:Crp/Fnr family transcriptional regulator n=1 Tax=Limosilactobacillus gastricus TaxID=227942 RepID=UPI0026ED20EF|nr:Crp/Fnr family transcriptional regulator [Limosilactobacillus gastricus]
MDAELCVDLVPLFQPLGHQQKMVIEGLVHRIKVDKGSLVIAPGDDHELIILASGQLKVIHYTEDGNEQLRKLMNSGDHLGESWLFGAENQTLTVVARQDSVVCTIQANEFQQLLEKFPDLSYQLLRSTIFQNNEQAKQIELLAINRLEERLRTYLTDLVIQQGTSTIRLPFELKDLAAYLGTTPETISRQLRKLKTTGEIDQLGSLLYQVNLS